MQGKKEDMDYREYMSLLSLNYQSIYSYILMLVANHNNADDIMQETTILMYEKFNVFEKGTDFLSWARKIAKYKTMEYYRKQKREKLVFDQDLVELIDQECKTFKENEDDWLDTLGKCVSDLERSDRELLHIRYHENASVLEISRRFGCSFQKVYRAMARINGLLHRCMRRKLGMEQIYDA